MKTSSKIILSLVWFAILGLVALGLDNPQSIAQSSTDSVDSLITVLCLTVPLGAIAVTTFAAFIFHRDTQLATS